MTNTILFSGQKRKAQDKLNQHTRAGRVIVKKQLAVARSRRLDAHKPGILRDISVQMQSNSKKFICKQNGSIKWKAKSHTAVWMMGMFAMRAPRSADHCVTAKDNLALSTVNG